MLTKQYRQKTDDGPVFLGDGSLAGPAPKLHQRGLRSVIKVVDDRCLYGYRSLTWTKIKHTNI